MPFAVITFDLDAFLRLGSTAVRWETLGLAASVLAALVSAAILARGVRPDQDVPRLHLDDLLYIALGAVPGALLGGRLGYALVHLDYYGTHPAAILDPGQGGLQLSLGVAGGLLTSLYVARVLGAPVGRWAHVAALPLLLAIEGGKAAMALGGRGQGVPTDAAWATRYLGAGPWGSLAPELSSHPAQLYEAAVAGIVAVVLLLALAGGGFRRRDGRLLLAALGLWLAGRALVAATWRDAAVLGPLSVDQLVSLCLIACVVAGAVLLGRHRPQAVPEEEEDALVWPDPAVAASWRGSPRG